MKIFLMTLVLSIGFLTPCYASEAENLEVANGMVEAINARNLDELNRLVAPDVVRHSAATPGVTVTNLDEFKAFLEVDFATVPDAKMKVDVIFGNEKYVAMRAIYSGTQTGPMGPFAASGKRFDLPFIGILRFEDGKISEMWVEWDNVHALTQLGHFGPPPE